MPFRENRQECRERQGKAAGEVGLSSQDPKEESVWVGLVSDIGSIVSRSNQDFTVIAQRHGDKQTQNIYSLSQNTENLSMKIRNILGLKSQLCPDQEDH